MLAIGRGHCFEAGGLIHWGWEARDHCLYGKASPVQDGQIFVHLERRILLWEEIWPLSLRDAGVGILNEKGRILDPAFLVFMMNIKKE